MNTQEYWKWVWDIWRRPTDWNMRLVFADWLQDHGCEKAARKQRQYAQWIRDADAIVWKKNIEQCWIFYKNRQGTTTLIRMKKDGHLYPMPAGMSPWLHSGGWQYLKTMRPE